MKAAVIAYTRNALQTACKAAACLQGAEAAVYTLPRFLSDGHSDLQIPVRAIPANDDGFYRKLFRESDLLIFVSALGIAVRKIAPFVKDKKEDPAVLCMDEKGRYVISVLSGHIGGANDAARMIAQKLEAHAVITTATDVNHRFSADAWAARQGLVIDDMQAAKAVSAAILEQDVPVLCEPPVTLSYMKQDTDRDAGAPPGVSGRPSGIMIVSAQTDVSSFPVGIYVGWKRRDPFPTTLHLIPRMIHLGIGCRKDTSKEQIERAVQEVFAQGQIDQRAVCGVFSIDLKKEEPGLLQFCQMHGWELRTYRAEELLAVEGEFSSSGFVQRITGVDNVCERAAMKDADELLVRKHARDGVTAALAVKKVQLTLS